MRAHLTAWMAALSMACPALAFDATEAITQPDSLPPAPLEYDSYYSSGAEDSPSDVLAEPAPIYAHEASPVESTSCDEPAPGQSACADPAPACGCARGNCCDCSCCNSSCCCDRTCCLFDDRHIGCPVSLADAVLGPCRCWDFGGWSQWGYHSDHTPLSRGGAGNQGLSFNDRPDELNLHQQWLWMEKVANGRNGLDWGFRFDVMYGVDAAKTQAFGNDNGTWDAADSFDHGAYGWAMPQAYIELAKGDWSVIAGHFYSLVGYESVMAPDNFFYSHALTMFNSEPFTHTGMLATYSGFDNVDLYAGWTMGWDTGFDQAFGGSNWLGGFSTQLTENIGFTYISTAGNFGTRSQGEDGYSHSLVFDVTLTNRLNYVLQSDLVGYDDTAAQGANDQVGINQYLFYTLNDAWAFGSRMEWWKSDGQSYYEITYGMNYRPHANVVIRPEVRHDWTPTDGGYVDGTDNATTFGIDCILTF